MKDFIAETDKPLLEAAALNDFEALWRLDLKQVDEANTRHGGVSSVYRLEINGGAYYLKRQQGYFTRSLYHPFGESLCAREWRNIQRFKRLKIASLRDVFFGTRDSGKEQRAILLTQALDGFNDLVSYLKNWQERTKEQREAIIRCCGQLARTLHGAGQKHGCLYPKHIFLKHSAEGWQSRLIDLEKARRLLPFKRDRISDLEPLLRRAEVWSEAEQRRFFCAYLGSEQGVDAWLGRIALRHQYKATR